MGLKTNSALGDKIRCDWSLFCFPVCIGFYLILLHCFPNSKTVLNLSLDSLKNASAAFPTYTASVLNNFSPLTSP